VQARPGRKSLQPGGKSGSRLKSPSLLPLEVHNEGGIKIIKTEREKIPTNHLNPGVEQTQPKSTEHRNS
jgi:hypothetical protein